MDTNNDTVKIKAYSVQELTDLYGVRAKTLRTWLRPHKEAIGKRESIYYTVLQVQDHF